MFNLTLLGSGGGMPMPNRFLSSLIINYQGRKILIDCGEGTQVAMRKMNTGFRSIDIICITHVHGDHIFGLPGLLSTIGNSDRTDPITIVGPLGIKQVMEGLLVAITYLPYDIYIIEGFNNPLAIINTSNGLQIKESKNPSSEEMIFSTIELDHSAPCFGYSFYLNRKPKFIPEKALINKVPRELWSILQNGEIVTILDKIYEPNMVLGEKRKGIKISFISDTRPIETIPDFISESDLFICEGTYGDNEDNEKATINKHMTFKEAAELANKGNVKQLLLTHFSSAIDDPVLYRLNAETIFEDTIIGYDGLTMTLSFNEK